MSPDKDIVEDRISHIRDKSNKLEAITNGVSLEEFKANFEKHYASLHLLQNCIEASTDIANHICSFDSLGVPSSYSEAFELLKSAKVISESVSNEMQETVRFRNRMVHLYNQIDLEIVYEIVNKRLGIFERFCLEIRTYLRS
jgi:uncharacterized protein YutE (UPF0331/DUF86 family)